jgi:hypothetical protein
MATKYSYSFNQEDYFGSFDTAEEAAHEAWADADDRDDGHVSVCWVGENVPPTPPESLFDVETWIEHCQCQDDYQGDWAQDWDCGTKAQREELQRKVRAVMAAWLDRHHLRPNWFTIRNPVKVLRSESKPAEPTS